VTTLGKLNNRYCHPVTLRLNGCNCLVVCAKKVEEENMHVQCRDTVTVKTIENQRRCNKTQVKRGLLLSEP